MARNPGGKEFARIGLGAWEHSTDQPGSVRARPGVVGPGNLCGDDRLVMHCVVGPGTQRPDPEASTTRVSEFDRISDLTGGATT
jgi:hypothetical protein